MRPIRVVINDQNDITRKGIEAIIEDKGDAFQVVGTFAELSEAERYLEEYPTDILILEDQSLLPLDVIRLVSRYYDINPGLSVILMSLRRDGEYIQQAMRSGNVSYLLKTDNLQDQLLKALEFSSNHYPFISPEALKLLGTRPLGKLTHREKEVLRLMAKEFQVKEISHRLKVVPKTIYRIRDKFKQLLGVGNNESLVDAARKQGWLDD